MKSFEAGDSSIDTPPDFRGVIDELLAAEHPDVTISDTGRELTATLLREVWQQYGDSSQPHYRTYHNHKHSLDVLRRTLRILAMLRAAVPERVTDKDFELAMVMAAGHDSILEPTDQHSPEELSAMHTVEHMPHSIYSEDDMVRVSGGIIATTADFDQNGVHQNHVDGGRRDVAKLAVALADVNGILLEGKQRMINDIGNLALEALPTDGLSPASVSQSITRFADMQRQFHNERRSDLPMFLAYYFSPEELERITKAYETQYRQRQHRVGELLTSLEKNQLHLGEFLQSNTTQLPANPAKVAEIVTRGITKTLKRSPANRGKSIEN